MTHYEFETIIHEIQMDLDAREELAGETLLGIADRKTPCPMHRIYHCDISGRDLRIIVNRDLLLDRYPYADQDTIRQILLDDIEELRRYRHI